MQKRALECLVVPTPETGKHFDFEWSGTVAVRVESRCRCPYLTNDAVWAGFNDLATTHSEVASQWHPIKNGDLTPQMVTYGSSQLVWWLYPYDDPRTGRHFDFEWSSTVAAKVGSKYGCPYLTNDAVWVGFNDLATTHPEVAAQWHPTKNGNLTPEMVTAGSNQLAWWYLPYIKRRTNCPSFYLPLALSHYEVLNFKRYKAIFNFLFRWPYLYPVDSSG